MLSRSNDADLLPVTALYIFDQNDRNNHMYLASEIVFEA